MKNKIFFPLFTIAALLVLLSCSSNEIDIEGLLAGESSSSSDEYSSSSLEQGLVNCQLSPTICQPISIEACTALSGTAVAFCPASPSSSSLTPSSSSSAAKSSSSVSSSSSSSSTASSSSSVVQSSSSVANTYTPAPAITCAWTPETVLTGDKTTLSISTTDANCTVFAGIAYGRLTPANGLTPAVDGRDTVVWQNGAEITANSNKLVGKNGRGDTTFTISATAGVSTTQNHVKAFAYCSADGKSGVFTQACTLKIQVPPNSSSSTPSSSSSLEQGLVNCQLSNSCQPLSVDACKLIGTVVETCPVLSSSSTIASSSSSSSAPSSSSSSVVSSSSIGTL